jgi:D-glycero-alpha-D-manno-heptose-7-phosphate kinase
MIITKTPYRISLFGGGTDLPEWYHQNGGAVLAFSIDKYCYILARNLPPYFDYRFRLSYSRVETCKLIDEIKHPALREAIRNYAPDKNLEINHHSDLPARSGIGSSSAFAVGLVSAISQILGKKLNQISLADEAIKLEQNFIGESVGSQDQITCSIGGINHIEFGGPNNWSAHPVVLNPEKIKEIEERCFLVFSGVTRISSEIQSGLTDGLLNKKVDLEELRLLVYKAKEILEQNRNLDEFGELLKLSWKLKKSMNAMSSTSVLDDFIDQGFKAGAIGAKVLGAGGGGFILFWLREGQKNEFSKKFSLGTHVPFEIDFEGSTVLESTL